MQVIGCDMNGWRDGRIEGNDGRTEKIDGYADILMGTVCKVDDGRSDGSGRSGSII